MTRDKQRSGRPAGPLEHPRALHSCVSLWLAMGVPLEVVSDTLGHAAFRVTMDVYGHLPAPAKMQAADAIRRALWLEDLPVLDLWLQRLTANADGESPHSPATSDLVGLWWAARVSIPAAWDQKKGPVRPERSAASIGPVRVGSESSEPAQVLADPGTAVATQQQDGRPPARPMMNAQPLESVHGVQPAMADGLDAHCEAKIAATSATGSCTTGPVTLTSARTMVPTKGNGAS